MKHKYFFLLIIFLLSFTSSLVLTITPTPPVCIAGCDVVTTSKYASTLGIKNSIYGTFIFAILTAITFLQIKSPSANKRKIIHSGVILGTIVAIYFIYLQIFTLFSYCKYCLVVDIGLIIALFIIIFSWRK